MTALLKKAFTTAAKLPKHEQDVIAALLLEELKSEAQWTEAFKKSQAKLAILADEASAEFERGETEKPEPDE